VLRSARARRDRDSVKTSLDYVYGYFDESGTGLSPNAEKHSNNAVLSRVQLEF
jgi:hypothetical protein